MVAAPQAIPAVRNYTLVTTVQHNPALRNNTHPNGCAYLVVDFSHPKGCGYLFVNSSHPKGCGNQSKDKSMTMVAAPQAIPAVRTHTLVAASQANPAVRDDTHPKGCAYQVVDFSHPEGCGYQVVDYSPPKGCAYLFFNSSQPKGCGNQMEISIVIRNCG